MAARIQSLRNGIDPVAELSRNDLVPGDVVVVASLDAATTYNWTLTFVPEGSTATFSGSSTAVSPGSFTIDEEGPYLVRLIVDAGLPTESIQYVRLRALTAFGQLTLVAAGERRDGTGIIPVDVDPEGWANEQNANIQTLKNFIKPLVSSGRLLYVDANDGTSNYADYSTVQAAVTAAVTAGASEAQQWVIAVRPGRYVESVTFSPWVHVFGWPGNPDGKTSEAVVIEGLQSVVTASNSDRILLANLHIENNANSATSTITKTGLGALRLKNVRVESNGTLASQGAALNLSVGSVEAIDCTFIHTSSGGAIRRAYNQSGTNTTSRFEGCTFQGPSGISLNSSLVVGVQAVFSQCRIVSSHASGAGILSVAELCDFQHGIIETASGNGIYVNPLASVYAGPVGLSVCFSSVEDDIIFDTTNLSGTTTLNLGAVKYSTLSLPGGAVTTQRATSVSRTHYYDNSTSGLTAENVQDAIDEIAGGGGSAPNDDAQWEMTIFPNNVINTYWFAPYNCTVVGVKVYGHTSPTTSGVYTLAVEDLTGANNLLAAATFDMTSLAAATLTSLSLTGTTANLDLPEGTRVRFQLVSDNGDLVASGIFVQILFRSQ